MEKRFYLGAALLALMLFLGILTTVRLENTNGQIVQMLEATVRAAQDGDMEQALTLARRAQGRWRGSWKGLAAVSDHRQMDEISFEFKYGRNVLSVFRAKGRH